jgi:hypothetical protein
VSCVISESLIYEIPAPEENKNSCIESTCMIEVNFALKINAMVSGEHAPGKNYMDFRLLTRNRAFFLK